MNLIIGVLTPLSTIFSAISWRPVLVVEEAEYPERTTDHGQAIDKLYHLRLRVECTHFVIYKAMLLCNSYTCQLYIFFVLGQKLKCRALLSANIPLKKHLTNPAVLLIYVWQDIHVYMGEVSIRNHHINNVASYCCWLLAFTAKQMYKIVNKQSV